MDSLKLLSFEDVFLLKSEAGNVDYQVSQSDIFIPYLEVT